MRILVLFLLILGFSSCATIVSDSYYSVAVNSSPEGATFEVKNQFGASIQTGTTPSVVVLPASYAFFSGSSYIFSFSKDGYGTGSVALGSAIDPWFFGNFFLGLLPFALDAYTGSMYQLPTGVFYNFAEANINKGVIADTIPATNVGSNVQTNVDTNTNPNADPNTETKVDTTEVPIP